MPGSHRQGVPDGYRIEHLTVFAPPDQAFLDLTGQGMDEIADSLARALGRIDDFKAIQAGADCWEMHAAVELLQESVGIHDDERVLLRDWLDENPNSKRADGHVLLGLIVGLTAGEEA
jgi:hypothetical protein